MNVLSVITARLRDIVRFCEEIQPELVRLALFLIFLVGLVNVILALIPHGR